MDNINLGAIERLADNRDILLGAVQAPVALPPSYLPDNSWVQRNFQGKTAFCGEHAGTHFKAILDCIQNGGTKNVRKSPRYGVIKLKTPSSPVYDGFPIDAGTDMRSIFKWLQKFGAADYEPLEDDVTLPTPQYCDVNAVTPAIDANAAQSTISSYGFGNTDFESLCQSIYQNKAVLLLIKCDDGFWGTATPTFTTPKYGHFVVADGFDQNHIRVIDSADPIPAYAVKMVAKQFIIPQFIMESGTAVDLPPSIVQVATHPDLTPQQKQSIIQQILDDIQQALGLVSKELGQL